MGIAKAITRASEAKTPIKAKHPQAKREQRAFGPLR